MLNMKNIILEFKNYRNFKKKEKEFDIVFYSEKSSYFIYYDNIIRYLIKYYNYKICYLTSSAKDNSLNKINAISKYYIGEGTVRTILFSTLDVKIMVMTMPDLNKYHIRRSNKSVKYVYIPHNLCSTNMVFRKGAFDHYDIFLCTGDYQYKELREAEKFYSTNKKKLIKIGYPRLDDLYKNSINHEKITNKKVLNIFIAPSWFVPGIIDTIGSELVDNLLSNNHKVYFRPHRDSRKYVSEKMDTIKNKYLSNKNFFWLEGKSTNQYLIESHILITDWSGSAFSFAFGIGRPIISIDLPPKINNPDYVKFKNKPFEISMRKKIGPIVKLNQLNDINKFIEDIADNYSYYCKRIRKLGNEKIYNIGKSTKECGEYLSSLIKNNLH